MSDTQWPRFIVFQQSKVGLPHEYAGSVHAPDAELALMNARDVFVRRPECINLWVVRADKIFTKTLEELVLASEWSDETETQHETETYHVFQKIGAKGVSKHVGDVEACSSHSALKAAMQAYPNKAVTVWWVFPARAVRQSTAQDVETMFAPAHEKMSFRDQAQFHTVATMKQLKSYE
jgi:ring-1,2-phenylacetyl-CoA epoxidase subunit PaaB